MMAGSMPIEETMAGEITAGSMSEEMTAGVISRCKSEMTEAWIQCDENGKVSGPLEYECYPTRTYN